ALFRSFHDFAGDVGEAKVAALEAVGEAQVIEAEEVEDRGVEIVDMHRVARDVPADLVGFAIGEPAFDSATGEQDRKRIRMMISTGDLLVPGTILAQRGSAELTAPDDERFIEQSAFLEVVDQRRHGLVAHTGVEHQFVIEIRMMIPGSVDDIDEANATLHEPSREEAIGGEALVLARTATTFHLDVRIRSIDAITIERARIFF